MTAKNIIVIIISIYFLIIELWEAHWAILAPS